MKRFLILLLTALVFSPVAQAQVERRTRPRAESSSRVPAFRGSGGARETASSPSRQASPLSQAEKQGLYKQLGKTEPGSLYVRLTPSQPTVADKGALVFVNAAVVESGENHARWRLDDKEQPSEKGYVSLWLKSNANRRYLIDCAVEEDAPLRNPRSWNVVGPGNASQTWSSSATHLVFTLDAATSGWYGFSIYAINRWWFFYSCEVTNL